MVPPATPAGTYKWSLTASSNAAGGTPLVRSGTVKLTPSSTSSRQSSASPRPPRERPSPSGQSVASDYKSADETNGSGLNRCTGPVPAGAAIDTASVGDKTFSVDAIDRAGNTATVSHAYKVVAAPAARPAVVAAPPPGRINVTIAFDGTRNAKSSTFTLLQLKGAPSGASVDVVCSGKACPKRKGKATRLTKPNAPSTLSLKPWLKKPLRVGTVLKVTVTKPGSFGMVKTFKVRANQRPLITTTCLEPNSKTSRTSCTA